MTDATIHTDGASPAVRLERQLTDPPPVVWRAITEPEQLRSWFPCDVLVEDGEWIVGATLTFTFPPDVIDMTLSGEVLEVEEPSRLAFRWGEEILRFELNDEGGGTRFVLLNELESSAAARNAAGWDDCLDRLGGVAVDPDAWKTRFDKYRRAFESELGPQEGPPAGYKGK